MTIIQSQSVPFHRTNPLLTSGITEERLPVHAGSRKGEEHKRRRGKGEGGKRRRETKARRKMEEEKGAER
jgi:hypothetical protein